MINLLNLITNYFDKMLFSSKQPLRNCFVWTANENTQTQSARGHHKLKNRTNTRKNNRRY